MAFAVHGNLTWGDFMRISIVPLASALLFLCLVMAPENGPAETGKATVLNVSAGVGLKDALFAIQKVYGNKEPTVTLEFNFAASGFLRKQIEEGAPVDLFLGPGQQHFRALRDGGYTDAGHSCALLGNRLVLVVAREKQHSIRGFADLPGQVEKFAIGLPDMVPAGTYARQTLKHLRLWNPLEGRMVYGKSVRQVLAYVDSGNADAGMVFASDASLLTGATVVAIAPEGSHRPIVFSMAGMLASRHPGALEKFMEFLKGREAADIFSRFGFTPLIRVE